MSNKKIIFLEEVRDNFIASLDSRHAALWINISPNTSSEVELQASSIGLPWSMVISDNSDLDLIGKIEDPALQEGHLVRKRGFIQVLDSDPSRIQLPQRCLPVYLLNGRTPHSSTSFENELRRLTMLEDIRRRPVRELIILSNEDEVVPSGLKRLWANGFRANLTFVSNSSQAEQAIQNWFQENRAAMAVSLVLNTPSQALQNIVERYEHQYPEDRHIIRVRDVKGDFHKIDVTEIDDPERPILTHYSLIEEKDLSFIAPDALDRDEFISFFENPEASWRPYAAHIPWMPNTIWEDRLDKCISKLDSVGSDESCIAYISSEPGAGATTMIRTLAWLYASKGYPVLTAKPLPFTPNAITTANYLNRIYRAVQNNLSSNDINERATEAGRRYETPWVIAFDRIHWEHRENELFRFCLEMRKHGRPVCILIAADARNAGEYADNPLCKMIGRLSHDMTQDEVVALGAHLNKYLKNYGIPRSQSQWDNFYKEHTVRYLSGQSSFWVALSFWIQGQYDLTESIQEWVYSAFKANIHDKVLIKAILEIAVMGSERLPLPEGLLPISDGEWPISHTLEEVRSSIPSLGLTLVGSNGDNYWALVHDILGRLLLNAVYYDAEMREKLGYSHAKTPDHFRFLLLRSISHKRDLGETAFRKIGEDFAISIFKIDPDHGKGQFALFWREVLETLETMPQPLRNTSRLFRHHVAISRRRISKLDQDYYGISNDDKVSLLEAAIVDIKYALDNIEYAPDSESNLNLYNSLARGFLDLAEVESSRDGNREKIADLYKQANEATRKAYEESPDNSFVVETYVSNLLASANTKTEASSSKCIEALGVLYTALLSSEINYRRAHLGILAERAFKLLLEFESNEVDVKEPTTPMEVLLNAWVVLSQSSRNGSEYDLSELSEEARKEALKILDHPAGHGDLQIIRFRYQLLCTTRPFDYASQIECMEQLIVTNDSKVSPQQKLEYAILLYQTDRGQEGGEEFKKLRRLWRETDHFVQVPSRLRWLRKKEDGSIKPVSAVVASDYTYKSMALVRQFVNQLVPFRPQEFGLKSTQARQQIQCHVSFGHNGPLLRPLTAGPGN